MDKSGREFVSPENFPSDLPSSSLLLLSEHLISMFKKYLLSGYCRVHFFFTRPAAANLGVLPLPACSEWFSNLKGALLPQYVFEGEGQGNKITRIAPLQGKGSYF